MEIDAIRRTAVAAAYEAGRILTDRFGRMHTVRKKGGIDLVTEADTASEAAIVETIRFAFPGHSILAEEEGEIGAPSQYSWIVDPLDGTTNYAHHLPIFSVSIAFTSEGDTLFGLVFNPITQELFIAEKGRGATLNGRAISVSRNDTLNESLLVTGFPYDLSERLPSLIDKLSRCVGAAQGVRRLGSAALDLCFVACGRFDGFWEESLKPWDTAAGALILTEAGGHVTDFAQAGWNPFKQEILATNGLIHDELAAVIAGG
ncbi:MAG: inositol monophosphatase [Deltaproteobacteria bacterium]|nr:inositol monophosphatase [Deltaproteobacteria bacterium]